MKTIKINLDKLAYKENPYIMEIYPLEYKVWIEGFKAGYHKAKEE